MIDEIALVTAISGVCSECETFQITWKPTKTDSTKTMKCCMKLAGAIKPRQQHQPAADDQQRHLAAGLRLEGRDFLRAPFFRRQFLRLFLRLGRRDGRDLRRRRREGDRAVMGHGRAADHVIFHVVDDHAVLLRRQIGQHVADVGGIERRGLRRHPAGEIGIADDGHAIVGDDLLVRHRQVAVAATLGGKVDDDRAGLHHLRPCPRSTASARGGRGSGRW